MLSGRAEPNRTSGGEAALADCASKVHAWLWFLTQSLLAARCAVLFPDKLLKSGLRTLAFLNSD
jgi:hypothetical protein